MTWRELVEFVAELPERFLDTEVQLYDASNGSTYVDTLFATDATDDDYVIDVDQPQIWFNIEDVE
jgi:hypothetical protein